MAITFLDGLEFIMEMARETSARPFVLLKGVPGCEQGNEPQTFSLCSVYQVARGTLMMFLGLSELFLDRLHEPWITDEMFGPGQQ